MKIEGIYPVNFLEDCGIGKIQKVPEQKCFAEKFETYFCQKLFPACYGKRNLEIIRDRYREYMSYRAIGKKYRISTERARQITENGRFKMSGRLIQEDFIRLLAECNITVTDSMTADALEAFYQNREWHLRYGEISIAALDFSTRTRNALTNAGLLTVKDILEAGIKNIRNVRNMGEKSAFEVQEVISELMEKHISVSTEKTRKELYKFLEICYPNNLLSECGSGYIEGEFSEIAKEKTEILIIQNLSCKKPERNFQILKQKYQQDMSDEEIAAYHQITPERVRQIIMTSKKYIRNMLYSNTFVSVLYEETEKGRISVSGIILERLIADMKEKRTNSEKISIDELPISVRSANALKRAGYCTAGEILAGGADHIKAVSYLGTKCFQEIAEVMILQFGANPDEWK